MPRAGRVTPGHTLLVVALINLAAWAIVLHHATSQPWLGLSLVTHGEEVRVESARGPATGIPAGAILLTLTGVDGGGPISPRADDLLEEPDVFASYGEMDAFFARQAELAALLAGPVRIDWRNAEGATGVLVATPVARPLASLPPVFWFQLFAGAAGCLIACWVWVLRPRDWGARMFAGTGVMFPVFTLPAAVYGTRELALPAPDFFLLSTLNHFGAFLFGAALIGIFLSYPRQLVAPRHLLWAPALAMLVWLADSLRLAPDPDWGHRLPIMAEMLLAMALAMVQWRKSRRAPIDRAALRWFMLSTLVGCGLFVFLMVGGGVLGWIPPLAQGYAFGFFLIMYVGLALGLRRHRLFELDEWAWRVLLWVGGALAVFAFDAALILALRLDPAASLGLALLACGWLYFPARQWLWQRIGGRATASMHEITPDLVDIAFTASRREREARWEALLRRLYQPLEIAAVEAGPGHAHLDADGLSLSVPPAGGLRARVLRFPNQGRRLFSPRDVDFIEAVRQLLDHAEAGRDAYEQGASEERRRIARDMHDDVGARLLMLIHRAEGRDGGEADVAAIARAAMRDLRTALTTLDTRPVPLADALADWRAETGERCEAAGVALDWRETGVTTGAVADATLSPRHKATFERALREAVTNALKHAGPRRLAVAFELIGTDATPALRLSVSDDGAAAPPERWREGRGLRGLRARMADIGGQLDLTAAPAGGTHLSLRATLA